MPGPLSFLDGRSRDEVTDWLRKALTGKTPVPRDYPDEGIRSAIVSAEPLLESQTRRDLADAVRLLLREIAAGQHRPGAYVIALAGLIVDLRLEDTVTNLVRLAKTFPGEAANLSHAAQNSILFAIVDLSIPQPHSFWTSIWAKNKRCFSAVALAGLRADSPFLALPFLRELPDSADLGDTVALQLDYTADTLKPGDRLESRRQVRDVSVDCPSRIRKAIDLWLAETGDPPSSAITPLALALGIENPRTEPARLVA